MSGLFDMCSDFVLSNIAGINGLAINPPARTDWKAPGGTLQLSLLLRPL